MYQSPPITQGPETERTAAASCVKICKLREEEEEGVRLEAVDGAGDVGPGDARRFCGVATAERGEFAFLGVFTFVAASAIVVRAVRVGVSNVRMRVRVTVATADLLPET